MNLGETVIYYGLKGCFYVGVPLCSLLECNIFGERAAFGMDACHVFPQGVLAPVLLIGGVFIVVLKRAHTGCWVGPPLCSVGFTALLGRVCSQLL